MKRLMSILLVVLLLMNASGYYLISVALTLNDKAQFRKLASDEYSGSDAIIIKLPFALPYSENGLSYESAKGKFTFDHQTYRIVKRRMMNDSVFIVCVRDHIEGKIRTQMNDIAKSISDSPQNHKQGYSALSFIKDYLSTSCRLVNFSGPWAVEIDYWYVKNQYCYLSEFSILQPPRA